MWTCAPRWPASRPNATSIARASLRSRLAPSASSYSAVGTANRLGNTIASVGRPRIGINGYDVYKQVLKSDRAKLNEVAARGGQPQKLVTWTLNDELEMREVLAIGVDGMLTDDPALLNRLLDLYKLR